ncbi:MAG: hypothetical protein ACLUVY_05425 [Bacteroides uniformis]
MIGGSAGIILIGKRGAVVLVFQQLVAGDGMETDASGCRIDKNFQYRRFQHGLSCFLRKVHFDRFG